jgi:hypothetical protein
MDYSSISIEAAIDKRDFDKKRLTERIFDVFREPLSDAARRLITLDREITWVSIERIPHTLGFVTLQGRVGLKVGDVISVEGKPLVIDDNNLDKYHNILNLTASMIVLESKDVNVIHEHLQFMLDVMKSGQPQLLSDIMNGNVKTNADLLSNPEHKDILEKLTRPRYISGFDTVSMSPEQVDALQFAISSAYSSEDTTKKSN